MTRDSAGPDDGASPVTLITGGTSGIEAAAARRLLSAGHRVAVTGRDKARLDRVLAEVAVPSAAWRARCTHRATSLAPPLLRRQPVRRAGRLVLDRRPRFETARECGSAHYRRSSTYVTRPRPKLLHLTRRLRHR
jgi:NAD(P)-dependent dehydrogenase (short-subunit alcohol dehydrogenase family)